MSLFRHERDDMDAELRSHILHRTDDLERSGLPRPEAERRARVEFGAYERIKEECREARGIGFGEKLLQDARFSLRTMRKNPAFTAVAVLTLALGIAANAVVFSVLNAFVLRPIDLPRGRDIYMVENGKKHFMQSYPDYKDVRDRTRAFEGVVAFSITPAGVDTGPGASTGWLYEASGNYFDVLGVKPYRGRFFHGSDERGPNSAPYAVLSYPYWRTHFNGDPSAVGRTIQINKYPFTVIGVAPPEFRGTALIFAPDLWAPMVNQAQIEGESLLNARGNRNLWIVGKVKPGVTRAQLGGDLDSIARSLAKEYPKQDEDLSFELARPELMGDRIGAASRAFVAGLMALAALILLAACCNLGSLFAARAADRSKEIALRLALGSGRSRILRQLMTEAMMISLLGGIAGLAGSMALVPWLSAWQPLPDYPVYVPVRPDASVYVVSLLLALGSGLLLGMVPLRQVFACHPYQVIKAGETAAGRRLTLRELLLAGQIAICAVLVTASLVAVRGLVRSLHSSFGFETQGAVLVNTDMRMARYSAEEQVRVQRRMVDAALAIPGVTAAAIANTLPLNLEQLHSQVYAEGTTDLRPSKAVAQTLEYAVSPGYFEAAGTSLRAGRAFTWHDDEKAPRMAVVNQAFARRVFGSAAKAVGGHYKHRDGTMIQVVGVAEDGKYESLTEDPTPVVFFPILQSPSSGIWMVVRSGNTAQMERAIRAIDPGLPLKVRAWHDQLDSTLFAARVATVSLGVLGALGALLAITGIFGMAAYTVSRRFREFGIRLALGAQRSEVLQAALGGTFRLLAFGSLAGLLVGIAAGRVLSSIVYQATPRDPMVLAGVLATMLAIGLAASWAPAARALGTDPSVLLREE